MGPRATGTQSRAAGAPSGGRSHRWSTVPELAVMANVLNPETESITLNTELETPTLDPATELEPLARIDQPSRESTSNPETAAFSKHPRWTPMP